MYKNKINNLVEYLSLLLILSYFFIHNILIVLIGIIFSLYLININLINSYIKYINNRIVKTEATRELVKNDKDIKDNTSEIKSTTQDSNITLVETVEELGFIPLPEKNSNSNVA